jgi:hypothetical protein
MRKGKLTRHKINPIGLKLTSIFFIVLGFLGMLGIVSIILIFPSIQEYGVTLDMAIVAGIFVFIISLAFIISGIFLWKRKNWARIFSIVVSVFLLFDSFLFLITSIAQRDFGTSIFSTIFILVVFYILYYLLFNKTVKRTFK